MWHVETDLFAMAVFLIMLIKEYGLRRERRNRNEESDIQADAFYLVLICSILSDGIDIIASVAMNDVTNWWVYQITMTAYVISMPLLAAVWTGYACVMSHKDYTLAQLKRRIACLFIPYGIYTLIALTNPVSGLFFKLTSDIEYSRGILFMPVGVGAIMFYSIMGLLLVFWNRKRIEPTANVALLISFFIVTGIFIWVQLANPGWLIINASYAVVYVWCDITVEEQRRRVLYQQIREKNEELSIVARKAESAAQAKTEFLSRMSHDIRTPMNAIIGLTHLAKEEENLAVVQEYLNKIDSASQFLLGLINDILDMSKIENGDLTLKEGPFTRSEFEDSINTVIRPLMDEKKIEFVFQMSREIDCIRVDRLRFSQIFFNLLSNASKFTPTGGTVEFLSETMPPKNGRLGMRFYVRDNGIGMSEEFLTHMYDPFSQERSSVGDSAKGTGLGLPIVKSLVDAMDGKISVKSQLGQGTEFIVELYVEQDRADKVNLSGQTDKERLQNARILLVEDNEINIYVAQVILEKVGCRIEIARNGLEAVERFKTSEEHYFDVILMDVRMPLMNGLEASKAIRSLDRADAASIPIIAMTADAFDEERQNTLDAGMNYHLAKPINPEKLYGILCEYL